MASAGKKKKKRSLLDDEPSSSDDKKSKDVGTGVAAGALTAAEADAALAALVSAHAERWPGSALVAALRRKTAADDARLAPARAAAATADAKRAKKDKKQAVDGQDTDEDDDNDDSESDRDSRDGSADGAGGDSSTAAIIQPLAKRPVFAANAIQRPGGAGKRMPTELHIHYLSVLISGGTRGDTLLAIDYSIGSAAAVPSLVQAARRAIAERASTAHTLPALALYVCYGLFSC